MHPPVSSSAPTNLSDEEVTFISYWDVFFFIIFLLMKPQFPDVVISLHFFDSLHYFCIKN